MRSILISLVAMIMAGGIVVTGDIAKIETTQTGMLITYTDGTGYYIGE